MAMDLAMTVDLSVVGAEDFVGALEWMQTMVIMGRLHSSFLTANSQLSKSERRVVRTFQDHDCIHHDNSPVHGAYYHLSRPTLTTWERMRPGVTEIACHAGSPVHRALVSFEALGLITLHRSGNKSMARLRIPDVRPSSAKVSS